MNLANVRKKATEKLDALATLQQRSKKRPMPWNDIWCSKTRVSARCGNRLRRSNLSAPGPNPKVWPRRPDRRTGRRESASWKNYASSPWPNGKRPVSHP